MIITLTCPEHGDWHPDLKNHRSRSTCPGPGCKYRGVPRAAQFRAPGEDTPHATPAGEPDNGVRLADVDAATAPLHPALRAMIRLMLSAVCARYHLREARLGGHLSGISAGPTQRGKTLVAAVVCAALGLDEVTGIRQAAKETELSLWGRRTQEPGGRYVLTPAAVLGLPFVALDELDKATGALLKAALRLLQGDARVDAEGQPVDIAPTAYATSNAGLDVLPESYRRRSACLDATAVPELSYATARQVLSQVPRLSLGHLAPPATELPTTVLDRMEGALRAGLTAQGWALCDVRALELAALGRAGLTGSDLADAAMRTVVDYLELAATTAEAHPGWVDRLDAWASGEHPAGGPEPGHPEDPGPGPGQAADAYWDTAEAVGYAGTIGHRLDRAIEALTEAAERPGVPAGLLDEAAGITQMAKQLLRPDIRKARDVARLAEILPTAQRVTQLAEQLAARMRAGAAAIQAGGYAEEHEAAITAELDRRALAAAAEPAAIEAPRRTRADLMDEYMREVEQRILAPAGILGLRGRTGQQRRPAPVPQPAGTGGLRFQTTMRPLTDSQPGAAQPAAAALPSPATKRAWAAARHTAADTTIGEYVQQHPGLTDSEIARLCLAAANHRPAYP